jgi:D-alanyl-D-alanine dipeptidase
MSEGIRMPIRSFRAILLAGALALSTGFAAPPFVLRPIDVLIQEARAAAPPQGSRAMLLPDLVELTSLDPSLRLDIRYASRDNFLHTPVYKSGQAFLQRPVAAALVRANRALQHSGFALRIHDAYRPWWVTKVFWEATEPAKRDYVADPAKGSVHNRGCAVDLSLVHLADGSEAVMPSGYDDFSVSSHADFPGGTAEARHHRGLLRSVMEAEGFKASKEEWWHFDHPSSAEYPILNLAFESITGPSPDLTRANQILRVTTADWNSPQGSLQRFERSANGALVPVGAPLAVWLGRAGMGWRNDEGAPPPPGPGPVKREGDGRSPAGILTFGDMWGYARQAPEGVRFSYRSATDCDRCVDDADHADYGKLIRLASPQAPVTWRSAEKIRLDTEHYRYLLVIHYNDFKPRQAAGSCIFLHVAVPPGRVTAGCTALEVDDLLTLLRWMDPAKHPVLVQVPTPYFELVRTAWSLPSELTPTER